MPRLADLLKQERNYQFFRAIESLLVGWKDRDFNIERNLKKEDFKNRINLTHMK